MSTLAPRPLAGAARAGGGPRAGLGRRAAGGGGRHPVHLGGGAWAGVRVDEGKAVGSRAVEVRGSDV
jgi:hypothetical protein